MPGITPGTTGLGIDILLIKQVHARRHPLPTLVNLERKCSYNLSKGSFILLSLNEHKDQNTMLPFLPLDNMHDSTNKQNITNPKALHIARILRSGMNLGAYSPI